LLVPHEVPIGGDEAVENFLREDQLVLERGDNAFDIDRVMAVVRMQADSLRIGRGLSRAHRRPSGFR